MAAIFPNPVARCINRPRWQITFTASSNDSVTAQMCRRDLAHAVADQSIRLDAPGAPDGRERQLQGKQSRLGNFGFTEPRSRFVTRQFLQQIPVGMPLHFDRRIARFPVGRSVSRPEVRDPCPTIEDLVRSRRKPTPWQCWSAPDRSRLSGISAFSERLEGGGQFFASCSDHRQAILKVLTTRCYRVGDVTSRTGLDLLAGNRRGIGHDLGGLRPCALKEGAARAFLRAMQLDLSTEMDPSAKSAREDHHCRRALTAGH